MLPDRVLNPGPLTYESGALPIALRGPAHIVYDLPVYMIYNMKKMMKKREILLQVLVSENTLVIVIGVILWK